jgi:mannose-1-phosphate guanylyltransferase
MRAIVLAAGLGTRLGKLGRETPKCLIQVGPEPLLERLLEQLFDAGIEKVLINTHHRAELVRTFISQSSFASRVVVTHEPELLGTAGTLRANWNFFQGRPGMVLHGDNYFDDELPGLLETFDKRDEAIIASMLVFESDNPSECGIVEIDESNRVIAFHEKVPNPPSHTASAAIFVFSSAVGELIAKLASRTPDLSRDLIPLLLGRMNVQHSENPVIDIGTPRGLVAAKNASVEFRA